MLDVEAALFIQTIVVYACVTVYCWKRQVCGRLATLNYLRELMHIVIQPEEDEDSRLIDFIQRKSGGI